MTARSHMIIDDADPCGGGAENSVWIDHDSAASCGEGDTDVNGKSPFSDAESRRISRQLVLPLRPEYISFRQANYGIQVAYLEGFRALNLANEIFGFNGWSSKIVSSNIEFIDETADCRVSLAVNTIVRVTLKDGTFREDIGFGHIQNCRNKAEAYQKARKEAVTDAFKRTIRQFGNLLGNCLYDKEYIRHVSKLKRTSVPPRMENTYPLQKSVAPASVAPSPRPNAQNGKPPVSETPSSSIRPFKTFKPVPSKFCQEKVGPCSKEQGGAAPVKLPNLDSSKAVKDVPFTDDADELLYQCLSDSLEVEIMDAFELKQDFDGISADYGEPRSDAKRKKNEDIENWPGLVPPKRAG